MLFIHMGVRQKYFHQAKKLTRADKRIDFESQDGEWLSAFFYWQQNRE